MRMTPRRVNESRAVAVWLARALATLLVLTGLYLMLKRLLFALLAAGEIEAAWTIYGDIGEEQSFFRGGAMLVVGTLLGLGSSRIVRWLIVTPEDGCPRCAYGVGEAHGDGGEGRGTRCPECGLADVNEMPSLSDAREQG